MAQITLYLPDEVASRIRRAARQSGQSVSALMTGLATRELAPAVWPAAFVKLYGSWQGDFAPPADSPPDDVVLP